MQTDRLLQTALRLYQDVHDDPRTDQVYSSTLTLLTHLSNPLNLALLTSHFLAAPAVWRRPAPADPLRACARVVAVYRTAALHVGRSEREDARLRRRPGPPPPPAGGGLGCEAWAKAVAKGADERSGRWRHLLVLTGILVGMEGGDGRSLSGGTRHNLERAVVTAANLALGARGGDRGGPVAEAAVALALSYAFPLLSEGARASLDCDELLPAAVGALVGGHGLQGGAFLGGVDGDLRPLGPRLDWPPASPSFHRFQAATSQPLFDAAGPLSRVVGHAVEHARDARHVAEAQGELLAFTGSVLAHWQASRLSGVDVGDEAAALAPGTLQTTWPALWGALRKVLFAVVAVLQPVVARSLLDPRLGGGPAAPRTAAATLHALRNLYFVASRGNDRFQAYAFTYMASLDVLARHGEASAAFLRAIHPPSGAAAPAHALQRTLDLFYLNTAEHLPLALAPEACEALVIKPAALYLAPQPAAAAPPPPRAAELFEAAHAAVLSVLSCPHNAALTARLAPFYAEALLAAFPARVSPRQFRLAFRTLAQVLSPPFPVCATHPDLAETLLEMVRSRVPSAGTAPLPPGPDAAAAAAAPPASEQSALALALVDALPFLAPGILEDWMGLAAGALNEVAGPALREEVRRRFWEVLSSGEMDVERGAVGVAWWGTRGGREMVLFGPQAGPHAGEEQQLVMSGAIVEERGASRL